ncbi:MAG TPA: M3 family metallopeptidase [Polyangiaceae bacterium]|nr:M3 family metallopeptidase [Polyangiaceae bacterium]
MSPAASDNPLLSADFVVPFDRIRADHVEPAMATLLDQARAALDAIEGDRAPRTYENTLATLEASTSQLDVAMTIVSHLEGVASTPELRAAYNAVKPGVHGFYASIPLRTGLWNALKEYASTPEAQSLPSARKRFLTRTLDEFRRHGAELDDTGKQRLERISQELAEVTSRFGQNVLDATAAWELVIEDEKQLAGLPPSAVAAARQSAESKGKPGFRFTLQAPSLIPLLTYLDDANVREQVYRAYNTRATRDDTDNTPLLESILRLRKEQAALLGYGNFADFVLEDRMAETGDKARSFVRDLTDRTSAAFQREKSELSRFRRSLEGETAPELAAWDVGYYAEKQRQALYDFDAEALRPYFPLERCVEGLFEVARRLYGVSIRPAPSMPVWHPDVRCYELLDEDGTLLAAFYTDFYPREEKRGGAWMNAIVTGVSSERGHEPHLALICANVTPPIGDRPALLTHQDVTTLFHEFGHLLHHCLSRVEVKSLAGINVAWDFVELPSQIMENWCWEREALDSFAHHYETGEPIPDALFSKMLKARSYREASAMMRQLGFAAVDLALHIDFEPPRDGSILDYARRWMEPYAPAPFPSDYAMIVAFTHLFSSSVGYGAGYYSYKWAEVLDADAFSRFREAGVFNRQVGRDFRDKILARGNSDEPMTLYRSFMGREPSLDALLARAGLLQSATGASA